MLLRPKSAIAARWNIQEIPKRQKRDLNQVSSYGQGEFERIPKIHNLQEEKAWLREVLNLLKQATVLNPRSKS